MAKIHFDIKYRDKIESGEYKLETECGHPVSIMDWEWIDRNEKKCLAVKVLMDEGFNIGYLFDYDGKRHSIFPSDSDSDLFIVTPEEELTEWQRFISACLQKHGLLDCGAADRIAKESATELLVLARKQFIKDGYVIEKKAFHDAVEKVSPEVMKEVSENIEQPSKFALALRNAMADTIVLAEGKDDDEMSEIADKQAKRYAAELLALAKEQLDIENLKDRALDLTKQLNESKIDENSIEYNLIEFMCNLMDCPNWSEIVETAGLYAGRIKAEATKDFPRWQKWGNGACGNGIGIPLAIVKRGFNGYKLVDALGIPGEQYIMLSDLEKLSGFKEDRV